MQENIPPEPVAGIIEDARVFYENERFYSIDEGIARKRPMIGYLFGLIGWLSRWSAGNALLIAAVILFYRGIRLPRPGPVFQLGLSFNNDRMFRLINAAAGRPDWNETINGESAPLGGRLSAVFRSGHLWHLANELAARPSANAFAHTQLLLTAAAYAFYARSDLSSVRLVCISCDHSPIVLGLLRVARERDIRTCYIQHAPVADYFPPLDYNLAILYDRESAAIYDRAAARRGVQGRGAALFLPSFREDFVPMTVPSPPYRVGICVSYLFLEKAVTTLTQQLQQRPEVSSVLLRRHPACKADLSSLLSGGVEESPFPSVEDFLDDCDIVLVPNSGVAIECLHRGKPTFYVAGTDDIEDDYYGFVSQGILARFDQALLSSRDTILGHFDAEWESRFARYDPTIETPIELLRQRAGQAFLRLLE